MSEDRHGTELGQISIVLSAMALMSVLPALNLMATLWEMRFGGLNVLVVAGSGFFGAAIVQVMAITAVVFGCRDVSAAKRSGRSPVFGGTGVALGCVSVLLWTAISVQWFQEVSLMLW